MPTNLEKGQSPAQLENIDVRVVVFSLRDERLRVLLSACPANHPGERWELPGSPVPVAMSLEETATQSVLRLSGLREAYLEQLYTYGEAERCPSRRLISVVYFAIIPAGAAAAPDEKNGCHSQWFPVDDLPGLVMDHAEVVAYAFARTGF